VENSESQTAGGIQASGIKGMSLRTNPNTNVSVAMRGLNGQNENKKRAINLFW
jgi:hypothetical protein